MRKIVVIGLGLHARHYHYKILESLADQFNLTIELLIDLDDQQGIIREYLATRTLKPKRQLYLSSHYRLLEELPPEAKQCLDELLATTGFDGVLISTEPKSHKAYALWAIHNHLDVLIDKPISAPIMQRDREEDAQKIFNDYSEIALALKNSRSHMVVLAPRRHHRGIDVLREYLGDQLNRYEVPITFIGIHHSEGQWNMPDEFHTRENHPYKYGYGLLLHSGYHQIDLFYWLLKLNFRLSTKPDHLEITARCVTPFDFLQQVNKNAYQLLFNTNGIYDSYFTPERLAELKGFGETDISILCQAFCDEAVITTSSINLLQTSFSRRAWSKLPLDTYKGNGRTRHENLNIQMGPLINIQTHSYQGAPLIEGVYRIMIFRNAALIGGQEYEQIDIQDPRGSSPGDLLLNARIDLISRWLAGQPTNSDFVDHCFTDEFLMRIHTCMFKQNAGMPPSEKMFIEGFRS